MLGHTSRAIDPNVASFSIQKKNGKWTLEMVCAPEALERAMESASFSKGKLSSDNENHRTAISDYLKQTVNLVMNDSVNVDLSDAAIKISASRVSVRFVLSAMPEPIKAATVTVKTMSDNENHVNLLKIFAGEEVKRLLLDRSNNYKERTEFTEQSE